MSWTSPSLNPLSSFTYNYNPAATPEHRSGKSSLRELVDTVHKNTSIDWTVKESVKAKLRSMVKRILRKHGYPPDKQEKATQTVLEQAELLCRDIAA